MGSSLKKLATSLFLGKVIAFVVRFFLPVILVRMITKTEYGIYQQFLLMTGFFMYFLNTGIRSSLLFFYPKAKQKEKSELINQTFLILLLNGFVFTTLFYVFESQIYNIFGISKFEGLENYIPFFIFFIAISSVIEQVLVLQKNAKSLLFFFPIDNVLRGLIILVSIFYYLMDASGIITGLFLYSIIKFIIVCIYLLRLYPLNFKTIKFNKLKTQIKYSLPLSVGLIFSVTGKRLDKIIINHYITVEDFAIYAIAFLTIPLLGDFYNSINQIIMPEITKYLSNNSFKEALQLWQKAVIKNASITIPSVFFVFIMSEQIITLLYTEAYIESANYMRIIILSFLFTMTSYALILRASGKTRVIMVIEAASVLISLIIAILIIPIIGIYGAAITALISIALPICVQLYYDLKTIKSNLLKAMPWSVIFQFIIFSLPFTFVIYFVNTLFESAFISLTICSLIYFPPIILIQYYKGLFIYPEIIVSLKDKLKIDKTRNK